MVLPAPGAGQLVRPVLLAGRQDAESLVSTKAPSPTTTTTAIISVPHWPAVSMDQGGTQIRESALPSAQQIFTLSSAIEAFCFVIAFEGDDLISTGVLFFSVFSSDGLSKADIGNHHNWEL